jgi:hypothetical protein
MSVRSPEPRKSIAPGKLVVLNAMLLFICFSSLGKDIFKMPKDDFVAQFNGATLERIYCYKENGEKMWVIVNDNTLLILQLNDGKKKKVLLETVKYRNGVIEAFPANPLLPGKRKFNFKDVSRFEVEQKYGIRPLPYFDIDDRKKLLSFKNDSLDKSYLNDSMLIIDLILKNSSRDTLSIIENACYNMKFKDNNHVESGVVVKITQDSIYISNTYNQKTAETERKEYKIYGYSIHDISELQLLHSGGFYFRSKKATEWDLEIRKDNRRKYHLCWFSMNSETGKIDLVRLWLTNDGFKLVFESNGKVYWYGA